MSASRSFTFAIAAPLACLGIVLIACAGIGQDAAQSAPQPSPPAVIPTTIIVVEAPAPTPTEIPPTATPPPPTLTPPRPGAAATVLRKGPSDRRVVALTFDAGSDRGYAAMILDTLAQERVPASFGITGVWTERNADLVARMAREGHLIINHSYDHASFTGNSTTGVALTQIQRFAELDRAEQLIMSATGASTKPYFRPPYGDYDASVNRDVAARGYGLNVMWTIDSRGWMGLPAAEIAHRCIDLAEPGAIYVFHVGQAAADGPALPAIIGELRSQGYGFVRISELGGLQ